MIVLMKCVAEAVMHKGIRGLAELVPGASYLYDVANEAMKRMRERKRAADIRKDVMEAAAATLDEVKQTAAQVAREVAADGPIEDRIALEMYLTQIPGAIRQSLKRIDDPSGKTVPADFALNDASELLRRLPQRVARFRPGESLPGKSGWKLVEFLGSGGFGEVWLARNPTLSALQGAVKFGLDPAARDRLLRHEGTLINRVMEHGRHPNVVQLLDASLEGDAPWLMYEYVPGGDLSSLVLAWQALPAAERTQRVTAALQTLASAVGHFHRLSPPIVHRDLKPANVLLSGTVNSSLTPELKIADFGIGGVAAAASLAMEMSRRGTTGSFVSQLAGSYTPLYASPQQQRGEAPDPRDDVHALGVIAFQMLTGKLDVTLGADYAKTLRRLSVPEPLIELLGDCAAHDPDNRPKDAAELASRLEWLVHAPTVPQTAPPASSPTTPIATVPEPPKPTPPPERSPWLGNDEEEPLPNTVAMPCPECAFVLQVPADSVRVRVKCPRCKTAFNLNTTGKAPPSAAKPEWKEPAPASKPASPAVWSEVGKAKASDSNAPRQQATPESPNAQRAGVAGLVAIFGLPFLLLVGLLLVAIMYFFSSSDSGSSSIPPSPPRPAVENPPDVTMLVKRPTEFLRVISIPEGPFGQLQVSPDGSTVASLIESPDDTSFIGVWEMPSGRSAAHIQRGKKAPKPAVFTYTPDSQKIAVALDDGVRVVSVNNGTEAYAFKELKRLPTALGYTRDEKELLIGAEEIFVRETGGLGVARRSLPENGAPDAKPLTIDAKSRFVFDPSRKYLAVIRPGLGPIAVYDNMKFHLELGDKDDQLCTFSITGERLAAWDGRALTRWGMKEGTQLGLNTTAGTGEPVQLVQSRDGRYVVAVGSGATATFDITTGSERRLLGHNGKITRVAFNPAGTLLASVAADGTIRVRQASRLEEAGEAVTGHSGEIYDIQFANDGNTLVASGSDGLFIWSVNNPK